MQRPQRSRLLIVDDHRLVVEALASRLNQRYVIAGIAYDGDGLLKLMRVCPADCVLLDMEMPGRNGLQLIPLIRRDLPNLKILVVTMLVDRGLAEAALNAGANGFVPKEAPLCELEEAITAVLKGESFISSRVPKSTHRVGLGARHRGLHRLTPRQEQIVLMLGEGRSGAEISGLLHVGPSTITFHKQNLMRVLGFTEERELVRFAVLVREEAQRRH